MTTLTAPVKGYNVTNGWGTKAKAYDDIGYKGHNGLDYPTPVGIPVYAMADGTIAFSNWGKSGVAGYAGWMGDASGISVLIRHGDCYTDYCHLSRSLHEPGDKVKRGQLIGYTGATGYTFGPHLHVSRLPLTPDWGNGYGGRIKITISSSAPQPTVKPAAVKPKPKPAPKAEKIVWRMDAGDNLAKIVRYYAGPTAQQIIKANPFMNRATVPLGTVVTIPGKLEWVVERGDTWEKVARYYAVSVAHVKNKNPKTKTLQPGQVLRIQ